MPAAAVSVAIGATTFALLAVLVVSLVRQVRRLTASLERFRDEVQPLLEAVQRDGTRARGRRLEVPGGPGLDRPDDRIRR